jgi:hypothetical protein
MTLTFACADIKNELTGSARPDEGAAEQVSPTKNFNAPFDRTWKAALDVLDTHGILYEADKTNGKIVTEDKVLQNISGWRGIFAGSNYKAKQFIDVKKSAENQTNVKFSARFTKELFTVFPTTNKEYPETENLLRKTFFEELDRQLASLSGAALSPPVPGKVPDQQPDQQKESASQSPPSGEKVPFNLNKAAIYQAQQRLKTLGYDPGPIDGVLGKMTKKAVQQFQQNSVLDVTGSLDEPTLEKLEISK